MQWRDEPYPQAESPVCAVDDENYDASLRHVDTKENNFGKPG